MKTPCRFCGKEGCTGRDPKGGFLPGHSGHPGGNSKTINGIRAELKKRDEAALAKLDELLASTEPELYIEGLKFWGMYRIPKPKQTIGVQSEGNPLRDIPAHVLERWAEEAGEDGSGNPSGTQ